MPQQNSGAPDNRCAYQLPDSVKARQALHHQQAKALLAAYFANNATALAEFKRHPGIDKPDFQPTLLDARMLISSSGIVARRLSLEKLKKDAKNLFKQIKRGDTEALTRLMRHHNKPVDEVKLADVQRVIGHENGLSSWSKLKTHIEDMNLAIARMEQGSTPPDHDLKTLHIRCGNDIKQSLQMCGFVGDFLEVSNPFPQGPVPHFNPLDHFVQTRAQFIHQSYGDFVPAHYIENTDNEIRNAEQTLRALPQHYERVVLWYEHDSFDQLSKAYTYAHLVQLDLNSMIVECVQIDRFPGVRKFIGIGQLSQIPEAILALWPQRKTVTSQELAFGARCWQAFTSDDPTELWRLSQRANAPLPIMQKAAQRVLLELPWTENGLGLTEQLALEALAQEGVLCPGEIFNLLMTELEPLPFLGDVMLVAILQPLWQGKQPAIHCVEVKPDAHLMERFNLTITEVGRELLQCKQHWLETNQFNTHVKYHVGGVKISSGRQNWHWSAEQHKPVFRNKNERG